VAAVTNCASSFSVLFFILVQLVIFLPLGLVRNLAKLSTAALIADVFIFAGLIYIFSSEISIISKQGIAEVQMFNPRDFPLFIGYALVRTYLRNNLFFTRTAVFSFEGVGLVGPGLISIPARPLKLDMSRSSQLPMQCVSLASSQKPLLV